MDALGQDLATLEEQARRSRMGENRKFTRDRLIHSRHLRREGRLDDAIECIEQAIVHLMDDIYTKESS